MELKIIKAENALDGFDQLIEARKNGEFAVWSFGGYITTTDDVPENYKSLDYHEVIRLMQVKAFDRHDKLEEAKGIEPPFGRHIETESKEGFNQLLDYKKKGINAYMDYNGYVIHTSDIPENFESLDYDEVIKLSLDSAIETAKNIKEEAKNGKQI